MTRSTSSQKSHPKRVRWNGFSPPSISTEGSSRCDLDGDEIEQESSAMHGTGNYRVPKEVFPEQDLSARVQARKKKKLGDELNELRHNIHRMTFHAFHHRTHRIRNRNAVYFGSAHKIRPHHVEHDLERLLNVGHHSSSNPLLSRVGLYMEPMISAAHSGIGLLRALYNVLTWRDPILSFWITLALAGLAFMLAIFPWRLFFFVTGWLVLGPQNWLLSFMASKGRTPKFIKDFQNKQKQARINAQSEALMAARNATVPTDQPIIFAHPSKNTILEEKTCDPRELHEVCVPYSQLMHQRMYDWPPESLYSKCTPNVDLQRVARKLEETRHRRLVAQLSSNESSIASTLTDDDDNDSLLEFG